MASKDFYNTILCQTFSPCGKYLVAGDIGGTLSIFEWVFIKLFNVQTCINVFIILSLSKIINPDENSTTEHRKPKFKYQIHDDQINSLITTDKFLVCGGVGEINGYVWKTVLTASKVLKPSWTLQLPACKENLDKSDVNCLLYDEKTGILYAGCGDNNIHIFTLEDGRLVRSFQAHEDYIHCLHNQWVSIFIWLKCTLYFHAFICRGTQLVSSSEDGLVKIWDLRDKQVTNKITPYLEDRVARPNLGKWIGAVALSDNWLVCIFHLVYLG